MLDLHALYGTGGNASLASIATIAVNDLLPVAGVPLDPSATLVMWGVNSLKTHSIWGAQLTSLDMIDPINGEYMLPGASSTLLQAYKSTYLPYQKGQRIFKAGTNTAVLMEAFTIDYYPGGNCCNPGRFAPLQLTVPQLLAQDVANTWNTTGFAPASQIPVGLWAILGIYPTLITESHLFRFQHANFGQFLPGIPTQDWEATAALSWPQVGMKTELDANPGYQFVKLSELTGKQCCPIFKVSNAGTGLNIQSLACALTDTPELMLNIAKVG
jgi:hypothetical protein